MIDYFIENIFTNVGVNPVKGEEMEYFILRILCNLVLWGVFISAMLSIVVPAYRRREKTRKRILYNMLKITKINEAPENYLPIRYCNEDHFKRYWKFFPWEGAGWLVNKKNEVVLLSEHNLDVIEKRFPRKKAMIEWRGRRFFRAGLISWMMISVDGRTYYFTSESGISVFGSKTETQRIYRAIKKYQ